MQDMNTRLLSVDFNTFRVVYLTNVPTLENFALILFSPFLVGTSFSRLVWVRRKFHVVGSFDENTVFSCHGIFLLRPAETLVSLVSSLF